MSTSWDRVIVNANLISLPDIYLQLKKILDSNNYALSEIVLLIGHDPGLTARILKLVNSSFFGFAAKIGSVQHAVSILGTQQLHDLILTTSVADALGSYGCSSLDMKLFWQRSVLCAITARYLAGACNFLDSERLFVTGLLSSVGHLPMYQTIPELTQQACDTAAESGHPLFQVERQIIGFDHAMVAAALLKKWQLPNSLTDVVENHLELTANDEFMLETAIIHIAAQMTETYATTHAIEDALAGVESRAWNITELDSGLCQPIYRQSEEQLDAVINMLFPKLNFAAA